MNNTTDLPRPDPVGAGTVLALASALTPPWMRPSMPGVGKRRAMAPVSLSQRIAAADTMETLRLLELEAAKHDQAGAKSRREWARAILARHFALDRTAAAQVAGTR